jgi:hypothetical protein
LCISVFQLSIQFRLKPFKATDENVLSPSSTKRFLTINEHNERRLFFFRNMFFFLTEHIKKPKRMVFRTQKNEFFKKYQILVMVAQPNK